MLIFLLTLTALHLTTRKATVPVFASISLLCDKKTVVMVNVIEFIQRHMEVSCAAFSLQLSKWR